MTREYAAIQLLKLGRLTLREFYHFTCWPSIEECEAVLKRCVQQKQVRQVRHVYHSFYEAV